MQVTTMDASEAYILQFAREPNDAPSIVMTTLQHPERHNLKASKDEQEDADLIPPYLADTLPLARAKEILQLPHNLACAQPIQATEEQQMYVRYLRRLP